jgi:hypothetical protein
MVSRKKSGSKSRKCHASRHFQETVSFLGQLSLETSPENLFSYLLLKKTEKRRSKRIFPE